MQHNKLIQLEILFFRFQIDFNELIFILLGTLALTLCVEMPVKNLRNAFCKGEAVKNSNKMLESKTQ